ncbi:MAG: DUF1934 domain-containing protein [Clostridia bacterium]|nr:DUF1934 domain-containing protein [Clostridia bacterium]
MTVNSIISMKTRQTSPDGESYDIEMMCDAEYSYTPEKSILKYQEPEGSGLGKTETLLEVDDESVTITRSGENNSRMYFKKGEKYIGVYEMPFGMFTIHINSDYVDILREKDSAHILTEYTLELEGVVSSQNRLELDVKRKA